MMDPRYLSPEQRARMQHALHHHPKRTEVLDRAFQLGTTHVDTPRVARLIDHAEWMDEQLRERDDRIDWLKEEVRELKEAAHEARMDEMENT